jgi:class 3 adenylate cyclase
LQQARFDLQSRLLRVQQKQSATLLASMLPDEVLGEMNRGRDNGNTNENNNDSSSSNDNNNNNQVGEGVNNRHSVAKDFADVTVIFCMISDFDKLASGLSPELLVTVLNIIYTNFDTCLDRVAQRV